MSLTMTRESREWTLTEAARLLGEPQHRLIYLCEKGVVHPDFQDAKGRGSSRRFSDRNLLEFAVALRLRELDIGVAFVGSVVHVLRAFERSVGKELRDFKLPDSLREPKAPDLRVVIADGARLYFTLAAPGSPGRVYGGIDLQDVTPPHPSARALDHDLTVRTAWAKRSTSRGVGGPEGSRFLRLEVSITELARALDLGGG
jgi:DNA-binding transcriptional MerR regulator